MSSSLTQKSALQQKHTLAVNRLSTSIVNLPRHVASQMPTSSRDIIDYLVDAGSAYPDTRVQTAAHAAKTIRSLPGYDRLERAALSGIEKAASKLASYFGFGGSSRASSAKSTKREIVSAERKIERILSPSMTNTVSAVNSTRVPRSRTSRGGRTTVVTGCEPMFPLQSLLNAPTTEGLCAFSLPINPVSMPGCVKLKRFSRGYEKYQLSGSFKYVPGCGTTQKGACVMFIDYDPTDTLNVASTGTQNITNALAHAGAKTFAVFEHAAMPINKHNESALLFVDNDDTDMRFTTVGSLSVVWMVSDGVTSATKQDYGWFYFDWKLELAIPQEDSGIPTGDATYLSWFSNDEKMTATNVFPPSLLTTHMDAVSYEATSAELLSGVLHFPPGNFILSVNLTSTAGEFKYSGTLPFLPTTPAIWDPATQFSTQEVGIVNWKSMTSTCWLFSAEPWTLVSTLVAPTALKYIRIVLCAVGASPFASTWKKTRSLVRKSRTIDRQAKAIRTLQNLSEPVIVDQPVAQVSSSSSSSSSSSPSLRTANQELDESHFVMVRAARKL